MEVKRLLCLANSRRPPSGRCVAGKVVLVDGFGAWVRPVSERPTREISEEERRYQDGSDVRVFDIVDVPLMEPSPAGHQAENHVIDSDYSWQRVRRCDWHELETALDTVEGDLWVNGSSSTYGLNDRVREADLDQIDHSLLLIRPEALYLTVASEGGGRYPSKRRVRARFSLNGHDYHLAVTDPQVDREYLSGEDGSYAITDAVVCVSLAEAFHDYAYKLAAAILRPGRLEA